MFRFENQSFLYWLILIVVFTAAYVFLQIRDRRRMERYCEKGLLAKLTATTSRGMQNCKFALLMLALACFIIAAANPQTAGKVEKVKRKGIDIMLCLDVSNSMLATDIQPNRIDACKMAINRFIDKLEGDRVGLVVFAGKSFVQLPITTDYAAAKMFVNQINTQMMPTQGTDISAAMETAAASMLQETDNEEETDAKSRPSRVILIASDGEDHFPESAQTAAELSREGFVIHTIGIGSTRGVPIPIGNNGKQFKKDQAGNTVITRLNETTLKEIANASNGVYVHATNASMGFETILNEINAMEKSDIEDINFTMYNSYYMYPLAIGFVLLFIESLLFTTNPKIKQLLYRARKQYKIGIFLLVIGCFAVSCNRDHTRPSMLQKGNAEFSVGDSLRAESYFVPDSINPYDTTGQRHFANALEIYDSTALTEMVNCNQTLFNQIDAHYRLNNFDTIPAMADSLRKMANEPAFIANVYYNEGNSYMQQKQYGQAIKAYKEVLKRNPDDMDARYNLVYAQKMAQTHGDGGGGGQQNQDQQNKDKQQQNQQGQGDKDQQKQQRQNGQGQQQGQQGQQQGEQQSAQQRQQKDAMMRQLDALQQNERQTQRKINLQRVPNEQRDKQKQEKDW